MLTYSLQMNLSEMPEKALQKVISPAAQPWLSLQKHLQITSVQQGSWLCCRSHFPSRGRVIMFPTGINALSAYSYI